MFRFGFPVIAFAFFSFSAAYADEPVIFKDGVDHVRLGPQMDYLEDANKEWSIEDVTSLPVSDKFKPLEMAFPNFGFTRSAYWFRLEVLNATDKPQKLLLEQGSSWFDVVDLHIQLPDGGFDSRQAGTIVPFEQRKIKHINFLFDFEIEPRASKKLFIKLESESPFLAQLTIWTQESFWRSSGIYGYYFGFFFGVMFFAFLYNLFLFFSLRDRVYFYLSLWLVSIFMLYFSTEGFSFRYLWPESPDIVSRDAMAFACVAWCSLIMFTRGFLDTKTFFPRIDNALKVFLWIYAALAPAQLLTPDLFSTIWIPIALGNPVLLLIFTVGLLSLIRGNRAARFFLIGTTATLIGTSANIFLALGFLPPNFIFYQAIAIGTLIDAILLSFALSDRVKILREEKEKAQEAVIESEKLLRETILHAKDELAVKVEERTQELSTAKERAEEANKLKDQFVTLVSHDLRSPLGAIKFGLEFIESRSSDSVNEAIKSVLVRSQATCDGLLRMIDRLLDINSLRSGRVRPQKRMVATDQYLKSIVDRLESLAVDKGITIEVKVPEGHKLFVDPELFAQIIQNLVGNAIKFCGKNDTITVFSSDNSPLTLEVQDTGAGMPPEMLSNLFTIDTLTTSPGTKDEKGFGYGLPLCFNVIKTHGGDITVESKIGEGSVFCLTLPETKALALVVDDQEATRIEVADYFDSMGVEVIEASNGIEALDLLAEATPHLVITDIVMPEMDGFALLKFIRNHPALENVPVIMFTSSDEVDARERAFSLGANDFVLKPIVANDFIPRVQRFVKA